MATRVALVACSESTEGPWTLAKGNESGIKIIHLVEGEHVELHMEIGEVKDHSVFLSPGVFPLPWRRMDRYRVCKHVKDGVSPSPTTVEIVLNGLSASVSGPTNNS